MSVARVVAGAILVHLTLGTIYTIAVVRGFVYRKDCDEIQKHVEFACLDSDALHPDAPYACQGFFMSVGMFVGGYLAPKIGSKKTCMIGCISHSTGVLLSSWAIAQRSEMLFCLTYGVFFGLGCGIGYSGPLALLLAWMPDNKGLASGIVTAGFGAGTFVFSRVQLALVSSSVVTIPDLGTLQVYDKMPQFFLQLGIIYAALQIAGLLFLLPPPGTTSGAAAPVFSVSLAEASRTRELWVSLFLFGCQTTGVALTSNYQRDLVSQSAGGGLGLLTWVVPLGALGNTLGRLSFGQLETACGFRTSMMVNAGSLVIIHALVSVLDDARLVVFLVFCMWFCFGGNFAMFPTNTAKTFGPQFFAVNYAVVFLGFGMSSLSVGLNAKYILPMLSTDASAALRRFYGLLACQAAVVFGAVACGALRTPPKVQEMLKERQSGRLVELMKP
jgi:OFA family oxalate/formate antiporter-like MFS transporter